MVREAVTNVVRHSRAASCTVVVESSAVEVRDDGRGLGSEVTSGSGLMGLRSRRGDGRRHAAGGARRLRRDHAASRLPAGGRGPGDRAEPAGGDHLVITVLLADDQAMIRQAFKALLQLEADIDVVAQAGDVAETVRKVAETLARGRAARRADAVAEGRGADGIDACAAIMAAHPATRVIILTTFGRPGYLRRAMEAGAVGYMVKDAPGRAADRRHPPGPPAACGWSIRRWRRPVCPSGHHPLTARERDVLAAARRARRRVRSPAACSCPRARYATTCRRRWASSGPAAGPKPYGSRPRTAGWADRADAEPPTAGS